MQHRPSTNKTLPTFLRDTTEGTVRSPLNIHSSDHTLTSHVGIHHLYTDSQDQGVNMSQIWQPLTWPMAAFLLVSSTLTRADEPATKKSAAKEPTAEATKKPRVTISKETTFITEPLRKEGYVDYIEALNLRCSEGVTPENNAAVLFWRAMGPEPVPQEIREEFFRRLGMKVPTAKGDYFTTFRKFLQKKDAAKESVSPDDKPQPIEERLRQQEVAVAQPWSARKFPDVAAWLRENERPLTLIISGSKRPRRYDPAIAGTEGTVLSIRIHMQSEHRDAVRALVARAMLRLHSGEPERAWNDLLASHRIAHLESQS
jgi:hypothetical protein